MTKLLKGENVVIGSRVFRVGMPVKAMSGVPLFGGMYGNIACIKTAEKKADKIAAYDLYVTFAFPENPMAKQALIDRFGGEYTDAYDALKDWVHMDATDLLPTVRFSHMVQNRKSGKHYVVYTDGLCRQMVTDGIFTWLYEEINALLPYVSVGAVDALQLIRKLTRHKTREFSDLAAQIQDAAWKQCASIPA